MIKILICLVLFQIYSAIKMKACSWTFLILTVRLLSSAVSMMRVLKKMCSLNITMLFAIVLVLVSVVEGSVNSSGVTETPAGVGKSRMAWLRNLLDHHDWGDFINNNTALPQKCAADLRLYIDSLNDGKLWASKSKMLFVFL